MKCISSVVFVLITWSDVNGTWSWAHQLDLEQKSPKWRHPHSLWKHRRSTISKVSFSAIPFQSHTVNAQNYKIFLQYHLHHALTYKHLTADLQCHLPIWRYHSPLGRHFQKSCPSRGSEASRQPPCSPDISPCDYDTVPKPNKSLRQRTISLEVGHSDGSSVRGGTE